eukprot:gene5085-4097_t
MARVVRPAAAPIPTPAAGMRTASTASYSCIWCAEGRTQPYSGQVLRKSCGHSPNVEWTLLAVLQWC